MIAKRARACNGVQRAACRRAGPRGRAIAAMPRLAEATDRLALRKPGRFVLIVLCNFFLIMLLHNIMLHALQMHFMFQVMGSGCECYFGIALVERNFLHDSSAGGPNVLPACIQNTMCYKMFGARVLAEHAQHAHGKRRGRVRAQAARTYRADARTRAVSNARPSNARTCARATTAPLCPKMHASRA